MSRGTTSARRGVCLGLVAAALALVAPSLPEARADEASDKSSAGRLVNEGNALFDAGSYALALEKYREAFRVYPSPKIRFNHGEALHALGRDAEAAEAYTELLESSVVPPDSPLGQQATQRLAELDAHLGRVLVRGADDAVVELDGIRIQGAGRVARVTPGSHLVSARRAGKLPFTRKIDVGAGEEVAVDATFVPAPAPGAEATVAGREASAWNTPPWWLWVAIGGAVVAGGVIAGVALASRGDRGAMGELGETSTAEWMRF